MSHRSCAFARGVRLLALVAAIGGLMTQADANIDLTKNGDVNGDGKRDVSDALYSLHWLFVGGPAPVDIFCPEIYQEPCDEDAEAVGISTVSVFVARDFDNLVGTSWLSRDERGVTLMLHASGIPAGHAVTLWLVIFNNPEKCVNGPGRCAGRAGDLENLDVQGDIVYVDGFVAGEGEQVFGADVEVGPLDSYLQEIRGGGVPSGLIDPMEAEFHLIVRSHGPVIEGMEDEMIRTFGGGCEETLPPGQIPEQEGECADLYAAIHTAEQ